MTALWKNGPSNSHELLVLMALELFKSDSGTAQVSMPTLADLCRVHPRSIQKIIRRLERGDWIKTEVGGGIGCSVYQINIAKTAEEICDG